MHNNLSIIDATEHLIATDFKTIKSTSLLIESKPNPIKTLTITKFDSSNEIIYSNACLCDRVGQ